jgi:hypothetical protein
MKKPNNSYDFGSLAIGESQYKHKAEYKRICEAWRSYMRTHPECLQWQMSITETQKGVIYKRLK